MKLKHLTPIIALLLAGMLSGCSLLDFLHSDDDEPNNPAENPDVSEITESNFQEVINSIDDYMDDFLGDTSEDNINSLSGKLDELKKQSWIEDADIEDNSLWIKVKNGGYILYGKRSEIEADAESKSFNDGFIQQINTLRANVDSNVKKLEQTLNGYIQDKHPHTSETHEQLSLNNSFGFNSTKQLNPQATTNTKLVYGCKNKKVLIADVTAYDTNVSQMSANLDALETLFKEWFDLYEVDHKRGNEITIDFLRDHLTDYGLVFFVAHGGANLKENFQYVFLEERVNKSDPRLEEWKDNEIIFYKKQDDKEQGDKEQGDKEQGDKEQGKDKEATYTVVLTPEFFNSIKGKFADNSIMVTVICQALATENNMCVNLMNKGLSAFIGFNSTCRVGAGEDAINSILQMFHPRFEDSKDNLKDAFKQNDKSPYQFVSDGKDVNCSMILKTTKDDIGLHSTVSDDEVVNLGLPSHWASHNLGAKGPEEYGDYYNPFTEGKYWLTGVITNSQYDIIKKRMGGDWHMPYYYDFLSFIDVCLGEEDFSYKGRNGLRVIGPSGESIFLPYTGRKVSNIIEYHKSIMFVGGNDFSIEPYLNKQRFTYPVMIYSLDDIVYTEEITIDKCTVAVLPLSYDIGCEAVIDDEAKTIKITRSRFDFDDTYTMRGVQKNNSKIYKSYWEKYNLKPSVKKEKMMTEQDVIDNIHNSYPEYKVIK